MATEIEPNRSVSDRRVEKDAKVMDLEALDQETGGRTDGGTKRRQIMDGARQVFLSAGFDGASMNDIARAAGVSKGTLYAYFDSKEQLFEAIIRGEYAQSAERLCTFRREGDPREMLKDFGVRLISKMAEPYTRSLARVVIAAAEKFPNVGRAFYEAGPLYGANRLAAELESLEKAGKLRVPDPERAAWQFVDLCQSYVYKRLLFGVVDSISREDIEASVEAGVDVFMKAYGV
ncbi:MAG TPA: TetR/AcrR family transcriptional regulator [Acetobacteraceae bacterium]|nr:TetR/AcrR family transcriptional regulator [Acetobacteraceae bacterium]